MTDEIQMLPIAGYNAGTLPDQCVTVELFYLASPFDRPESAQSHRYAMTAKQAIELAEVLQQMAAASENRSDRMPGAQH